MPASLHALCQLNIYTSCCNIFDRYDIVNVHLVKKPQWFLDLTILGVVPVFQAADGTTISESLFTVEYLEEQYPEPALLPRDSWKKTQQKVWGQKFGQVNKSLYILD